MKNEKLLLAIALLFIPTLSQSQFQEAIGKKLEKKAKQKVEQRVDKKIDQGIDKGLDKVEDPNTYKKDKNDNSTNNTEIKTEGTTGSTNTGNQPAPTESNTEGTNVPKGIFKSGDKSKVLAEYTFQHDMLMEMESFDKKGKSNGKNNMRMLYHADGEYFAGEMIMNDDKGNSNTAGFSIFDWKNNQMISLIDNGSMKMGMVMAMDATQTFVEENISGEEKEVKYKKTGRTKTLLGYLCEEYILEDEETTSEMWMSKNVDLNMAQAMSYFAQNQKSRKGTAGYPKDAPQGVMMEMLSTNKKTNEKTTMKVIEVNKNKKTNVKTAGYTFM